MIYKFNDIININNYIDKTIIFEGDNNTLGFVENNEVIIQNDEYIYEYRKGAWSIGNITNKIMFPCGIGAVPSLNITNIKIINITLWELIKYIIPIEE